MLNERSLKKWCMPRIAPFILPADASFILLTPIMAAKPPPKPTTSYTQPHHRCRLLTAQTSLNRHAVTTKRQQKPTDCDRFVYIDRNFNLDSSSELREFACLFPFSPDHPRTLLKLTSSNRHAVTSKQQP